MRCFIYSASAGSGLIRLPHSFVELYSLVNKVRGDSTEETDESTVGEAVICLLTGAVLRSGSIRRGLSRLVCCLMIGFPSYSFHCLTSYFLSLHDSILSHQGLVQFMPGKQAQV
jgi:hypothetical protein